MLPIAPRPCIVADFLLPHLVHTVSFTALLSSHPEEESAERSPHLFRPAVMGLYVERRCSTIREDTSETRMRPQPSRQGMPEPAGTQKRQRKSRWESNSFLLTKHIFYHSAGFLLSVLLQENKKGTNQLHFCNRLVPFRLLSSPSGDDLTILNSPAGHYHTVLRFHPRNLIDLQFPGSRVVVKLYPVSFAQQLVNRGYRFR